ncbi:MAG: GNAT family N-acetyltransferase [Planctomycetales bacterium]|nr:GNAT family N-acetyltransferase [Planctomycetales bacterium]MCA9209544.1 GNAT family N-acetyltransferase [Planctomycetales bacterium]MCA9219669.1 GNAT family N-acetyltransferase [Planctomycetales bacterium]MCA9224340.1 GNAT family N-acetyltransferase [Planctomycetales bacterium]
MAEAEFEVATFRPATVEDIETIEQLVEPYVAQRKLLPRTHAELARLIPHGFVAEHEGRMIGFAAIEIYSTKLAEIQCLAVAGHMQGKGIGKRLIRQCVLRAREHGIHELMAITASEELFKDCGFDYSLPDQKRALFIHPREMSPD